MPLQYKTRDKSSPQGKPRVYFCCHPRDHELYFRQLSNQILQLHNCAIWYSEDEDVDLEDLEQMQLFVMPVTMQLLRTENAALNVAFPFAIAHHIPVLPVLMDSSLDELFNETCGNLQYLDPNQRDETALSFEEKLKQFLDSILIGDELAEKIRAAFAAYIFLSYRKKDRRYAQQLMRLIHRNEFCRDLAIWYDEFLVPGEDFNDAIRAALDKSGLFVLAVTPNLVNELNYIMTTEYPMALKAGKPILPVELVETDRTALDEGYANLPPCTNAWDGAALSDSLLSALRTIALCPSSTDPQHNFFIGLAYLGGVDVEVDHERALQLITSAADAGLMEAVEKLVDMYRTGMGVERDYQRMLEWQERKLAMLEERYNAEPTEDSLDDLFWQHICCASACEDLVRPAEAKLRYRRILDWIESLAQSTGWDERRNISVCCERLGKLYEAEGDLSAARKWRERELQIILALAEESESETTLSDLYGSFTSMGNLCLSGDDPEAAQGWHDRALEVCQRWMEVDESEDARRALTVCYANQGELMRRRKDFASAREWFLKAVELNRALVGETGALVDRRGLAQAYSAMGSISNLLGDEDGADRWYWEEWKLVHTMAQETYTATDRRLLVKAYGHQAEMRMQHMRLYLRWNYNVAENFEIARFWYLEGLEAAQTLAEESGTAEDREALHGFYHGLGYVHALAGKPRLARAWFKRDLELSLALAAETNLPQAWENAAFAHLGIALVSKGKGRIRALRQAEQILAHLHQGNPDDPYHRDNLEQIRQDIAEETERSKQGK